ncbi:hypothetical protein LINPERHAP2_LOCUS12063 [Linum perenne]
MSPAARRRSDGTRRHARRVSKKQTVDLVFYLFLCSLSTNLDPFPFSINTRRKRRRGEWLGENNTAATAATRRRGGAAIQRRGGAGEDVAARRLGCAAASRIRSLAARRHGGGRRQHGGGRTPARWRHNGQTNRNRGHPPKKEDSTKVLNLESR